MIVPTSIRRGVLLNVGANFRIHREANRHRAFRSCSILNGLPKYQQNLYNNHRPLTTKHCCSATIFRPKSARTPAPAAPPLIHFFRAPFPLFLSGQEPKTKMHHLRCICITFRPFCAPPPPPTDRPSAIDRMNWAPPENMTKSATLGHFRRHNCALSAHPCPLPQGNMHKRVHPKMDVNFHIPQVTTRPRPSPRSDLRQRNQQLSFLTPLHSLLAFVPTPSGEIARSQECMV